MHIVHTRCLTNKADLRITVEYVIFNVANSLCTSHHYLFIYLPNLCIYHPLVHWLCYTFNQTRRGLHISCCSTAESHRQVYCTYLSVPFWEPGQFLYFVEIEQVSWVREWFESYTWKWHHLNRQWRLATMCLEVKAHELISSLLITIFIGRLVCVPVWKDPFTCIYTSLMTFPVTS